MAADRGGSWRPARGRGLIEIEALQARLRLFCHVIADPLYESAEFPPKGAGVVEYVALVRRDVALAVELLEPILQLVRRSERNSQVTNQLWVRIEPATLGDVEMNGLR